MPSLASLISKLSGPSADDIKRCTERVLANWRKHSDRLHNHHIPDPDFDFTIPVNQQSTSTAIHQGKIRGSSLERGHDNQGAGNH